MKPLLCCLLFLGACASDPTGPLAEARRLTGAATLLYGPWYKQLESCSGLRGNFGAITFWTQGRVVVDGVDYGGYWYPDHRIVIRDDLVGEALVKHEEMHDLLRSGQHPEKYFNNVCGDLRALAQTP